MADFKVLIPLDGSPLAEQSLRYVGELKRFDGADLMLVSVVDESEDFGALTSKEASDREFNVLTSYLNDVSRDIQLQLKVNVSTKVVRGTPAHCILTEAKEYQPDLIMISTHGRSGLSRWRFGSVADKVIRGAENNVLVIGPKAVEPSDWRNEDPRPPFRTLLVPLDGSALAEEALPLAKRCAETLDSQLHLVRVVPIPTTDSVAGHGAYTPDLLDGIVEGAKTYLSTAADRLKSAIDTKTDVLIGQAAAQLVDYVASNDVDLVIMTSHGRSGILRTALGSVTDRLLGGSAPVLVVSSFASTRR
jgi:nucleotide-binding universal stress UspA family protein